MPGSKTHRSLQPRSVACSDPFQHRQNICSRDQHIQRGYLPTPVPYLFLDGRLDQRQGQSHVLPGHHTVVLVGVFLPPDVLGNLVEGEVLGMRHQVFQVSAPVQEKDFLNLLFIYWRLITQSTTQGHLRDFQEEEMLQQFDIIALHAMPA